MIAPTSLWTYGPFLRLLTGQTLAQLAAQISFLAVPLVATLVLDATPMQMGLLVAGGSLPSLIFGLHAGAIVDRRARRPVLVGADLIRHSFRQIAGATCCSDAPMPCHAGTARVGGSRILGL